MREWPRASGWSRRRALRPGASPSHPPSSSAAEWTSLTTWTRSQCRSRAQRRGQRPAPTGTLNREYFICSFRYFMSSYSTFTAWCRVVVVVVVEVFVFGLMFVVCTQSQGRFLRSGITVGKSKSRIIIIYVYSFLCQLFENEMFK